MFKAVFGQNKPKGAESGGQKHRGLEARPAKTLTRGLSVSLPSSPLLPRHDDVVPSHSCAGFPGRHVEGRRQRRGPLVVASRRGETRLGELHAEPRPPGSSPSSQELMTRLCFLLGEGTPGQISSPMEDRKEKKGDAPAHGGSPSSTLTPSTGSPCPGSPSSSSGGGACRALAPPPTRGPARNAAQCHLVGEGGLGPPALSPTSTLESKDSGIIATITSSSENEERSVSSSDLTADEAPGGAIAAAAATDKRPAPPRGHRSPARADIREPRTPPAPKRALPQQHAGNARSLGMPRPNSVAASGSAGLEDLTYLERQAAVAAAVAAAAAAAAGRHRGSVRKLNAAGRAHDDSKGRFKQGEIMLKPLLFEVPGAAPEKPFVGRDWLFARLDQVLRKSSNCEGRGAVIVGNAGSGKTATVWRLVALSCHGAPPGPAASPKRGEKQRKGASKAAADSQTDAGSAPGMTDEKKEFARSLANKVVAYHFCQADNTYTCLVPEFVHSVAALLARSPRLGPYRELLIREPPLQNALSLRSCVQDPAAAFRKGVLEPLANLRKEGRLPEEDYIILVDSLNEAEFHKPDYGDTIATFITKIVAKFPVWLKLVVTVRTGLLEISTLLPFSGISLDILPDSSDLGADLSDYVHQRVSGSARIAANVTTATGSAPDPLLLSKFCSQLTTRSNGSVLYLRLTLDLFHREQLALKGGNYLVVPVSLSEVYLLMCRASFPDKAAFERAQPVLNVALASLHPLTDEQMFRTLNAGGVKGEMEWDDFQRRLDSLAGFMVKRRDGTRMLCHPTFREWLVWRADGESNDFLCDPRSGHALLAFMFSRQEGKLNRQQTMELGHHILKAHIFKGLSKKSGVSSTVLQAMWVNCSTDSLSAALASLRNLYTPNIKVSRLLMLGGANVSWCTEVVGRAPVLAVHAHLGHTEMVALLLEMGAAPDAAPDVGADGGAGVAPLCLAAAAGHAAVVNLLCKKGAQVGRTDKNGQCALVHGALKGHAEIVDILLGQDWGSESPARAQRQRTAVGKKQAVQQAVTAAASVGHVQVVKRLLDLEDQHLAVQMDAHDSLWGETVLSAAAGRGRTEVCALLLERGAGSEVPNRRGMTPLLGAAKHGHAQVVELLLKGGTDVSARDKQGRTALILAAAEGHGATVEMLLANGAGVSAVDREGLSATSWACMRGHPGVLAQLLDAGADPNQADGQGRTPLDLAALNGDAETVHFLLEHGAALERTDGDGNRTAEPTSGCQNPALVASLLKKGSKTAQGYRTAPHERSGHATWAMASTKPDILLILLHKLTEEGNLLYKKGRMKEAGQRYQYALRKLPREVQAQEIKGLKDLRVSLYLNLSRCRRKTNDFGIAEDFATKALELKPRSYEAFYARARAKRSSRQFAEALSDLQEASRLSPANREIRRLLLRVEEECAHHRRISGGDGDGGQALGGGHREDEARWQGSLERPIPEEDRTDLRPEDEEEDEDRASPRCQRASAFWPLNPYGSNRTLPGASAYALPDPMAPFPPEDYVGHPHFPDLPEPLLSVRQQSQNQGAGTRHHCHSLQTGARVGGRPLSLCGPSSPLPGRRVSGSPRPAASPDEDFPGLNPGERYCPSSPNSCSPPSSGQMHPPRSASFSRGSDRLSAPDGPAEVRREAGGAGTTSSRGSSSSQASSGNQSDSGGKATEPPCPLRSSGSFKSKGEMKPRPFMGVADKAVRVQNQQSAAFGRQGRERGGGVESFGMSLLDFRGSNDGRKRPGAGDQRGRDSGEWSRRREARAAGTSTHPHFPDGRHGQASLARDNMAAPIKPKRSFIESNV
ncbi:protein TANC1-like [Stigmatopora argus]